jgi:hypothetical protein
MAEVKTQIAKFAHDEDWYSAESGAVQFRNSGLKRHRDLFDAVHSLYHEYKEREAADKKADIEKLENDLDALIDAERLAVAKLSEAENEHFKSMQAHATAENNLRSKASERSQIVFGMKHRVGLRKKSEMADDERVIERANRATAAAQQSETAALSELRYKIAELDEARAELKGAKIATLNVKARLDRLNGIKNDFSEFGLASS